MADPIVVTTAMQQKCKPTFMGLPAELRLEIYGYYFASLRSARNRETITVRADWYLRCRATGSLERPLGFVRGCPYHDLDRCLSRVALVATNHQINEKAIPVLYEYIMRLRIVVTDKEIRKLKAWPSGLAPLGSMILRHTRDLEFAIHIYHGQEPMPKVAEFLRALINEAEGAPKISKLHIQVQVKLWLDDDSMSVNERQANVDNLCRALQAFQCPGADGNITGTFYPGVSDWPGVGTKLSSRVFHEVINKLNNPCGARAVMTLTEGFFRKSVARLNNASGVHVGGRGELSTMLYVGRQFAIHAPERKTLWRAGS